jgi:DNA repair exonuclease SbcCD nuclease subunit
MRSPPCRLIHTSDLHLDRLDDPGCRGRGFVVEVATKRQADVLVIAGDFFDHNLVEEDLVRFAVGGLDEFPGQTMIPPGNHDCLVDSSVSRGHVSRRADQSGGP